MEEKINNMIERFNRRAAKDDNLRGNLEGLERTIRIEITDGDTYHFLLSDSKIVSSGDAGDGVNIRIITDTETMSGLLDGTVKPMKAYATKRVTFKASVRDMMLLKKLLM